MKGDKIIRLFSLILNWGTDKPALLIYKYTNKFSNYQILDIVHNLYITCIFFSKQHIYTLFKNF